MKIKILTLINLTIALFACKPVFSQQSMIYSQYGNNITPINQAGSLLKPEGEISVLGLRKWTGIEGAPSVIWANGYAPIKHINAAAGINVRYESVGDERSTDISAFFAKAIQVGTADFLSLSVNAGFSMYKGNFGGLYGNDPVFNNSISQNTALIGAGLMLYHPDQYYIGVSMPRFMLNKLEIGERENYNYKNQYYLTGGMLFSLDEDFKLKPAAIVSYVQGTDLQAEVSAMAYVKDVFGLGLNVRSYGGAAGLAQFFFNNFGIGYGYLFNTGSETTSAQINNSSHEFSLSYRFGKAKLGL